MAYRTLSLMLCFLLLAAPAAAQQVLDKVVAVVNGEMITLGEINGKLAQIEDQLPTQPSPQAQAELLPPSKTGGNVLKPPPAPSSEGEALKAICPKMHFV